MAQKLPFYNTYSLLITYYLLLRPNHRHFETNRAVLEGAPELIIEIAATTVSLDLHDKMEAYRHNQVQEYLVWRIYDGEFDWFRLKEGKYIRLEADKNGIIKSEIYLGLWLDVNALLTGNLAKVSDILQQGIATTEHQDFVNQYNGLNSLKKFKGETMVSTMIKLTFEEYLRQYPQGEGKFELIDGEFVKVEAIRAHKNVARFLVKAFDRESERLELDYVVDKDIIIRTLTKKGQERGRIPDVSIVKGSIWNANVTTYGAIIEPLELAVEVTSTNWDDDYIDKLDEYERLGIKEYWIVDFLAIASRNYLGNPKVPTVFVYNLVEGKYQVKSFQEQDTIISVMFPELKLTVAQILDASRIGKIF